MSSSRHVKHLVLAAVLAAFAARTAHAGVVISEVDPNGSGSAYASDWFELTNNGSTAVDLTGWKMDDNSKSFSLSVALRGVSSIAAGQSVVFIETASSGTDAATDAAFAKAWFGSTSAITIGNYQGSGVGLGAGGDSVVLFNSGGSVVASVDFGSSSLGTTFDNAAGLNNVTLTQQSVVGLHGAFRSADGVEVGSPGAIASVPEPQGYVLALAGLGAVGIASRRRSKGR